jgi:hypothetical protein
MKKIIVLGFCLSLLLAGCGQGNIVRYDTNPAQNVNSAVPQSVNANLNAPAKYVPEDLGMYQGMEYPINAKHTKLKNIDVVLNKITIVSKDFGRYFKLYKGITPDADQVRFVIADYTITAKADINLKDFSTYVTYDSGSIYDVGAIENAPYDDSLRFGFYPNRTDLPLKNGEIKNVKIVYEIMQSMMSEKNINLWIHQGFSQDDFDRAAEFDIAKYIK